MSEKDQIRELIHEADQLEEEIVPPSPALPVLAIPEINTRKIFIFLVAFYITAVLIRFLLMEGPSFLVTLKDIGKGGEAVQAAPTILFGYFLYMCVACQFFPIPTLPPIAFTAKLYDPILVAALGGVATCIANLNDYAIVGLLFKHHRVKKVRNLETYKKLLNFFDRYSFLTLSAASFLPIPVDVIRLLAISRAYSYVKYILATFTGRFPRYLIIAYLGQELPVKYILIIFGISLIPAAIKLILDIVRKKKKNGNAA